MVVSASGHGQILPSSRASDNPPSLVNNPQLRALEVLTHRAAFHLCSKQPKTAVVSAVVCVVFGPDIPHPFPLFPLRVKCAERAKMLELLENFWSERRDLNSGPPVPQTGVLAEPGDALDDAIYFMTRVVVQPVADRQ
jgi:hypothetical protein